MKTSSYLTSIILRLFCCGILKTRKQLYKNFGWSFAPLEINIREERNEEPNMKSMGMKIKLTEIQLKQWNEINKCYAVFVKEETGEINVYTTNNKKWGTMNEFLWMKT